MAIIKELSEVGFAKTLLIASIIIAILIPSNIIFYFYQPETYKQFDTFKLLLLTSCYGIAWYIFNFAPVLALSAYKSRNEKGNNGDEIVSIALTLTSIVILFTSLVFMAVNFLLTNPFELSTSLLIIAGLQLVCFVLLIMITSEDEEKVKSSGPKR